MYNPYQLDGNGQTIYDPSGNMIKDDSGDPPDRGPSEEKQACLASGGKWIGTGPYGQGYCQAATPQTGSGGCPEGQEKSPFDAQGNDASYPLECVSTAEAQRRFDLRKSKNAGGSTATSGGGGAAPAGSYKPTKSPFDAGLSQSIYDMIQGMMSGKDVPFGPDTIAKLQAAALESNKGQLANDERALERRLVAAGLTRTGAAPAAQTALRNAAASDLSGNFRTVALTAVQNNYNARVAALKEAENFLSSERANALSQDQMVLAYARLKQEWATTQASFAQQWKLAQNGNEQAIIQLLLQLKGGV